MGLCGLSRILFIIIFYSDLLDANQLATTGSSVQLICPQKAISPNILRWSYINGSPITLTENNNINKVTMPPETYTRLSVSGNHSAGEYNLNIADIVTSDQGSYECSVSMGNPHTIVLTVIVGPTAVNIANVTPDNKITGIEGQDMNIKCTAVGGQPAPDIKLEVLGSTYNGKMSAQCRLIPQRSDDGSIVSCKAGYDEINYYPLNTTAFIHIDLKPLITPFTPDILHTEETKSFDVSCKSTGSRPPATIHWLLKLRQQETDITPNASSQPTLDSSTYIVISNLTYRVDRRFNGQKLTCRASNGAGSIDTSLTFNVKYAPGVTVENKTFSQTDSPRQIHSTLDGNPPVSTCKWLHRSKYGEIVRQFNNTNQILTLPSLFEIKRYQDFGEYVCTATNGIRGQNGTVQQTGSGYVTIHAPPVITADNKDNSTQYGKFGKSGELKVNVYSIPKYSSKEWYSGNTLLNQNKYVTKEEAAIVKDVFHGVEVQLDGYRVTLTINDLQEVDFTNYTLRLYYNHNNGGYVEHEVILESAT